MPLVDIKESNAVRRSQERAAVEVYAPKPADSSSAEHTLVKGQYLDVDGVLARSLPNPGAFSVPHIKTIVLR
jgi:hypothetical protein